MTGLDDLDRRLIGLLRDDARLPSAALARRLGVSRGTVQNRIDRLIASGVVLGFTARLRGDAEAPRSGRSCRSRCAPPTPARWWRR